MVDRDDALPAGPLLAYCGDDFTGSTDVMEAFTAAGVPTVLFLAPPGPEWVGRFSGMRCIGLATTARGQSPGWMDAALPDAYARLKAFGAPVLQYKVCSTFDSSPQVGSIGRAIDLGVAAMGGRWSPMVVGAPRLRRWQAFGNLFAAAADGVPYRLDRHPTMSRHPVTPMHEADLRRHLADQTPRRSGLVDLVAMKAGEGDARRDALFADDVPIVLLDVVDEETLAEAGRLVWEGRGGGIFSASSSGLQYALAAHWRSRGWVPAQPSLPRARAVDAIGVVSGSCSPVTASQIAWAAGHGFHAERLDLSRVLPAATRDAEIERSVGAAVAAVAAGRSPLVYSAAGPDDPAVTGFDATARSAGLSRADAARAVGDALAEVMRRLLDRCDLRRIVVAGGDSSGAVAGALDIAALSVAAGIAPGAPLCRAWSAVPARDGLEVVLKGGQMGGEDFFGLVRSGGA
jgi:3-oxoisoapionate kinase